MKTIKHSNPKLDFIRLVAKEPRLSGLPSYTREALDEFASELASDTAALAEQEFAINGIRAEEVFRAVVLGLGRVRLLKDEDAGAASYNGDELALPDFRVVLEDGRQLLVEVKRCETKAHATTTFSLSDNRMQALFRYAELTGGELRFALFWEDVLRWTLVEVRAFERGEAGVGKWRISFEDAMKANTMCELGDYMIGIPAPLRLRFVADACAAGGVPEGEGERVAAVTIERMEIWAGPKPLSGESARVAWHLLLHGGWASWPNEVETDGGRVVHLDYVFGPTPRENFLHPPSPDACVSLGWLAEIISRCYLEGAAATVHSTSDSELLKPSFLGRELIPAQPEQPFADLPMSRMFVRPNYPRRATAAGKKDENTDESG